MGPVPWFLFRESQARLRGPFLCKVVPRVDRKLN